MLIEQGSSRLVDLNIFCSPSAGATPCQTVPVLQRVNRILQFLTCAAPITAVRAKDYDQCWKTGYDCGSREITFVPISIRCRWRILTLRFRKTDGRPNSAANDKSHERILVALS